MNFDSVIDPNVFQQVQDYLKRIEEEHDVVVLHAIESGSRAWGFPSPDSDYDVRFVYAHSRDWYLQLSDERDVIEVPISDDLDIAGWDLRKTLNLANKGNAVIQEWVVSPIVYQQDVSYSSVASMVQGAFNPIAVYHHYRSMAKKAYADIEQSEEKKLKRFFYFARATLSALWVVEKQTMPSILFSELVGELISERIIREKLNALVIRKMEESEKSSLEVPIAVYRYVVNVFESFDESVSFNDDAIALISNNDFRHFLNSSD